MKGFSIILTYLTLFLFGCSVWVGGKKDRNKGEVPGKPPQTAEEEPETTVITFDLKQIPDDTLYVIGKDGSEEAYLALTTASLDFESMRMVDGDNQTVEEFGARSLNLLSGEFVPSLAIDNNALNKGYKLVFTPDGTNRSFTLNGAFKENGNEKNVSILMNFKLSLSLPLEAFFGDKSAFIDLNNILDFSDQDQSLVELLEGKTEIDFEDGETLDYLSEQLQNSIGSVKKTPESDQVTEPTTPDEALGEFNIQFGSPNLDEDLPSNQTMFWDEGNLMIGMTLSGPTGNLQANADGLGDPLLVKLDSNGLVQSTHLLDSQPGHQSISMVKSRGADVCIAGNLSADTEEFLGQQVPETTYENIGFLAVYDKDSLTLKWLKFILGEEISVSSCLITSDQKFLVAGKFIDDLSLPGVLEPYQAETRNITSFLILLEGESNLGWANYLNSQSAKTDIVEIIERDTDFLVGTSSGKSILETPGKGKWDMGLYSFDKSDGRVIKEALFGTDEKDYLGDIAIDESGTIFVTGRVGGLLEGYSELGSRSSYMAAFDKDFNLLWEELLQDPKGATGESLAIVPGVGAYFCSDTVSITGSGRGVICQLRSSTGNLEREIKFVLSGNQKVSSALLSSDSKSIFLLGETYHSDMPNPLRSPTEADLFEKRYGDILLMKKVL